MFRLGTGSSYSASLRKVFRVQGYRTMGVQHIWIIDPETRACWTIE